MELIFWLAAFALCWFLYNKQENYASLNDCSCLNCGICRDKQGNSVCVPGNEYGPYFAEDCMNYTHSSLYTPYNDLYYYGNNDNIYNIYPNTYSHNRRSNRRSNRRLNHHLNRRPSHQPNTPQQTPPHTPRHIQRQTPPHTPT